jgi:hypothetical protein
MDMRPVAQRAVTAIALSAILLVAGCDHLGIGVTPIGDIVRDPATFQGKEVHLKGTVREIRTIPVINARSYILVDGSGEISVSTRGELPAKGEKLVVRGRVESIAIVSGKSFGTAFHEFERAKTF